VEPLHEAAEHKVGEELRWSTRKAPLPVTPRPVDEQGTGQSHPGR